MSIGATRKLRFNPQAEVLPLDMCFDEPMYQLRIDKWIYRVNQNILSVLHQFDTFKDEKELDRALQNAQIAHFDAAGLKELLLKRQILIADQSPLDHQESSRKRHPFAVRLPLLSQKQLQPLTSVLGFLFFRRLALYLVFFILSVHAVFIYVAYPRLRSVPQLSQQDWIIAIALCYLLLFIHELGHSSACTHYGAHHDDIGIGIYLIYPVLYANVTDCWRLSRFKRATVDIAGVYFQLLASAVCSLFWLWNRHPVLLVAVYSCLATTLINMNPFLRFDGYWLLTDLTALPSLQRSNRELWNYWWAKFWKRPSPQVPEFFNASPHTRAVFIVYSLCALSFFAFFFARLGAVFLPYLFHEYPRAINNMWHMIEIGQFNLVFLGNLFRLTGLSAALLGIVMMFARPAGTSLKLGKALLKGRRSSQASSSVDSSGVRLFR